MTDRTPLVTSILVALLFLVAIAIALLFPVPVRAGTYDDVRGEAYLVLAVALAVFTLLLVGVTKLLAVLGWRDEDVER